MRFVILNELGQFKNGANFKSDRMGRGIPIINVKDITGSHRIDVDKLDLVDIPINEEMVARDGDIFLVRSSVKLEGIALAAKLLPSEKTAIHCGFVIRFRPTSADINSEYLMYLLRSRNYRERLKGLSGGAAIVNISQGVLKGLEVSLPTLSQQQEIASILSAYDDLIENNRRRIQLLEQAARLLYQEWFLRLRFPGHEHVKIKKGVPEGWELLALGEVLTLQRGFDLPVSKRKDGAFPIYASTGINGYHAEAKVKGPGVVTGRSGSLGTVMYVPEDFWPLNTSLWIKEFKKVGPLYAFHLLSGLHLEQYNGGAAVPTLNRNDVHRIEVLCPSKTLLELFDENQTPLYRQIEILRDQNRKLQSARDLLLPRLMNGEIAV
jgi:type I restriction enzyme, S subunit